MEDKHFIIEDLLNSKINKNSFILGVYSVLDGHGGDYVVDKVTNHLPDLIFNKF